MRHKPERPKGSYSTFDAKTGRTASHVPPEQTVWDEDENWLRREIEEAARETDNWPEWMKEPRWWRGPPS